MPAPDPPANKLVPLIVIFPPAVEELGVTKLLKTEIFPPFQSTPHPAPVAALVGFVAIGLALAKESGALPPDIRVDIAVLFALTKLVMLVLTLLTVGVAPDK